ncbi:MAG: redoxin domain-containing protein [Planctomycetota bacterium]|jgi:peroxiredoxin
MTSLTFKSMLAAAAVMTAAAVLAVDEPSTQDEPPAKLGQKAPDFSLVDLDGTTHSLSALKGQPVVLFWFNSACPFVVNVLRGGVVASTVEQMKQIAPDARLLLVDSTADREPADVVQGDRKLLAKYELDLPVLLDHEGTVGHRYDARTTPHVFVIDAEGVLRYHGEFTDDPMGRKPDATNRVLEALRQITNGESVSPDYVRPWGCSVKYKKKLGG